MSKHEEYVKNHIHNVELNILKLQDELRRRGREHDASKLREPEKTGFEMMDKEPRFKYGSDEYFDKMKRFEFLLSHHYALNSHHPEHYEKGWREMDLIDITEMLCDWLSYKEEFTCQEAMDIIDQQCMRFDIPHDICSILKKTASFYLCKKNEFHERYVDVKRIMQSYEDILLKTKLIEKGYVPS